MRPIRICKECGKEKEHHAKGLCYYCYKKFFWKPEKKECKRCGRIIAIHAKGLCPGCYQFIFHIEKNKAWNKKNLYNLNYEVYNKITEKCIICDFNKLVDLHHLDENRQNNSEENLIGLCPNHHQMLHNFKFRKEIRKLLKDKGIILPEDKKLDFTLE
ncbi:hypothetical protein BMS3Abin17_01042 [archaeon BMS3Abin17]|nr:hypothetical protein BMS3Abin17_01042 [archaeon BMS3Abin17]HDZ61491.1 hypothetical protein [Candidatus Pacearchaeota archaeon]